MACSSQPDACVQTDDEGELKCKAHCKIAILACMDCGDALCCDDCVVLWHQGHRFKKIDTLMAEKRESLANHIKDIEEYQLPALMEQMRIAKATLEKNKEESEEAQRTLREQTDRLKSELDKVAWQRIRQCREMKFENESKLTVYKEHMENILKEYRQKIDDVQQVVNTGSVEEILHLRKNLPKPPETPQYPDLIMPVFEAGDPSYIRGALGTIIITPGDEEQEETSTGEGGTATSTAEDFTPKSIEELD